MPGTIRSVLRGERPIIRSDGQFIRDYFYVEDGAAAYTLLAEALATDASLTGEAFNFSNESAGHGLGRRRSASSRLMESSLAPDIRNEAVNEIRHQYLSAQRRATVRLASRSSPSTRDLTRTIAWYRRHLGGSSR